MKAIQKVPARKALRAIAYHLANPVINQQVKRDLCEASLRSFQEAVANDYDRYQVLFSRTLHALLVDDTEEFLAGTELLAMRLPPVTYGEITAGTSFRFAGFYDYDLTKRKGGIELVGAEGVLWPHLSAGAVVYPIKG